MNKTNKEVFELIIADKLTSLETEDFIEKETSGFIKERLEKLITDYETYILDKKPESILYIQPYFKSMFNKASIIDASDVDTEILFLEADNMLIMSEYEMNIIKGSIDHYKQYQDAISRISIQDTTSIVSKSDSELFSFPLGDILSKKEEYSPIFYVISRMEEINGNVHCFRGPIHFKKSKFRQFAIENALKYRGINRKFLAYFRKFKFFLNPMYLREVERHYQFYKRINTYKFHRSPTYKFYRKLHAYHRHVLISEMIHNKTKSEPSSPNNSDKSGDYLSPKEVAESIKSNDYSKEQVAFIMSYAGHYDYYDYTTDIISVIKEEYKFAKESEKKKDHKILNLFDELPSENTIRRWLDKYDQKNGIKRRAKKKK